MLPQNVSVVKEVSQIVNQCITDPGILNCAVLLGAMMPVKQKRRAFSNLRLWLMLTIVVIVGRACVFRPATNYAGAHFRNNAVWLGVEWVNEPHAPKEITALADALTKRQIRYAFVYTTYLRPDGQFNATYTYAAEFLQMLRPMNPSLNVQAWIGLPLGYVDLNDAAVRGEIVQFCVDLVHTIGFDGIHLDPEPISRNDSNVLTLLDELGDALGPEFTLSVATRRIWPLFPNVQWPIVGQVAWHANYYRQVASRVDQIAVMTYDSAIPLACLYRHWTRFQVIEISRAVDGTGAQVFFGVPTSEEMTWTHRPWAENMDSGLSGVIDGLNDTGSRPTAVTGVAIYPYWETDKAEWRIYQELWLGQSADDG